MDFEHAVGVALTSGVVSGVVVALVNDRLEKRRRDAAVREARRNDAARIVGPALASGVEVWQALCDAADAAEQRAGS